MNAQSISYPRMIKNQMKLNRRYQVQAKVSKMKDAPRRPAVWNILMAAMMMYFAAMNPYSSADVIRVGVVKVIRTRSLSRKMLLLKSRGDSTQGSDLLVSRVPASFLPNAVRHFRREASLSA